MFAGARFDAKTWLTMQKFDVRTLSHNQALQMQIGRLVEIHFHFRSKDVRHLKPNWFQSALWQTSPEDRRGFVSVPVMVAKGDVEAFKAFTADPQAARDLKVYGRVLHDLETNYVFVKLLGTSTFVDQAENVNVSW
jgi:hypothetical protein